jgi:hypothetical protein
MSEPIGAPLADGVVRMWWRPGLGSAPGCVDIGWMDNGHVICRLVPLSQAVTLVTAVAYLSGDPRPVMELVRLLRIAQVAHVAVPTPGSRTEGTPAWEPDLLPPACGSPELVDDDVVVREHLGVAG